MWQIVDERELDRVKFAVGAWITDEGDILWYLVTYFKPKGDQL